MGLVRERSDIHGNTQVLMATHTFGSAYAEGGDPSDPGFGIVEHVSIDAPAGMTCQYDYTNRKIKAHRPGSPLVIEEVIAISSNVGTLAFLPAYIVAVEVTAAGSVTGAFDVIPTGETPATKEVAVTRTTGLMTFVGSDGVTSVRVTYFRQITGSFFSEDNFTVDETVVADADTVDLAERAAAIQYIYDSTNGTLLTPSPPGEAPASGEFTLDINNSGETTIDTNTDIDDAVLKVTYLKYADIPADMFIDDTDITLSSEAWDFRLDGNDGALHVPGLGTQLVGESASADENASWVGPLGTDANEVAIWYGSANKILTDQTQAMLTTAISWLRLPLDSVVNVEVPTGTDLSSISARVMFSGQ